MARDLTEARWDPAQRAFATAQLAASIAAGVVPLSRNVEGWHTGMGSKEIAAKSVEIAKEILNEVGLGEL